MTKNSQQRAGGEKAAGDVTKTGWGDEPVGLALAWVDRSASSNQTDLAEQVVSSGMPRRRFLGLSSAAVVAATLPVGLLTTFSVPEPALASGGSGDRLELNSGGFLSLNSGGCLLLNT